MARRFRRAALAFALLPLFALASARADDLGEARALEQAGQYDKAIALLEKKVSSGRADAETYDELGKAYNWKSDNKKALENYRKAAKLDPKAYATSALQILNTKADYDEIVRIGEAAVGQGNRQPSVLVALLDAYFDAKKSKDYERILALVKSQHYGSAGDRNYRLYILAKSEIRAGHPDAAIAFASEMDDKRFLKFMSTMDLFEPIKNDARFKALLQ